MDLAVYNPHERPLADLPVIYGFNNGGPPGLYSAVILSQDGECLGGHVCSSEFFVPGDTGCLVGFRPDRHEHFRTVYPDGYRMEYVPVGETGDHPGLAAAVKKNQERAAAKAAKAAEAAEAAAAAAAAAAATSQKEGGT